MITQLNRPNYSQRNAKYNAQIATLADDLLGTHSVYPDYVPIREFPPILPSAAQARRESHVVKGPQPRPVRAVAEFDLNGLDAYEQVVFTSLAWGSYNLYCLVGEMGSGKTALVTHLAKILKVKRTVPCETCSHRKACKPVVIHLDFNEGFSDKNTEKIVTLFERRLYAQLKALLRDIFKNDFNVADFAAYAHQRELLTSFADFDDFFEAIEDSEDWKRATNKQRAEQLFAFIKRTDDIGYQIELLMRLLGYARSKLLPEPACIIVIYDNLDKIQYEAQMEILNAVMSYQHMANVRVLVPLRRTSFEKLGTSLFVRRDQS
jgi:energy-coupling factor transporter ATP-binding protein EcfA2